MPESIEVSIVLPVAAGRLMRAWLDSDEHSHFTGSPALIDPVVGGAYTAWDGYISGTTLMIEPGRRIVQTWRTTDFPPNAPDSRLEVIVEESGDKTKLILRHSNLPDGQSGGYEQGWIDYYFAPMQEFFAPEGVA